MGRQDNNSETKRYTMWLAVGEENENDGGKVNQSIEESVGRFAGTIL